MSAFIYMTTVQYCDQQSLQYCLILSMRPNTYINMQAIETEMTWEVCWVRQKDTVHCAHVVAHGLSHGSS